MKKLALLFSCMALVACGEKAVQEKKDDVVKQPFTLSDKPQTSTTESEMKQPFSLSDKPQTNTTENEVKQPFSLSSEPQTKSK